VVRRVVCSYRLGWLPGEWLQTWRRLDRVFARANLKVKATLAPLEDLPRDTDILVVPPDLREAAREAAPPGTPILVTPASAAAGAFAELVGRLDAQHLPFTARLLADPSVTGRPDAAVVTAARADLPAVLLAALGLHGGARAAFGDAVPGFTRAVAPGVAVADHPGPGPGFGRHRCGLVASGLLAAGPGAGRDARLAAVRAALTAAGLDPDAPHLGPGCADLSLSCW
jgi:hypothetical protein